MENGSWRCVHKEKIEGQDRFGAGYLSRLEVYLYMAHIGVLWTSDMDVRNDYVSILNVFQCNVVVLLRSVHRHTSHL